MTKTPHVNPILVTGAGGRLGQLLRGAAAASAQARTPLVFSTRHGSDEMPAIDARALPRDLPACTAVVGLWGVTSGTEAELAQNVTLAQATRDLALATRARLVFHLSSAGVYGPGTDLSETDPLAPPNTYSQSKQQMEAQVARFAQDGVHHSCLRLANVVGADSLAPALHPASGPVTLTRFADGRGPLRSYIAPGHLLDILRQLATLPHRQVPPVLNIAASAPVEMEALARAAGKEVLWKPETENDRQRVTLSTRRLSGLLPGLELHKTAAEMITDWTRAKAHS